MVTKNEKVIRNLRADLDHGEKLATSRRLPLAHAYQVLSMLFLHLLVILLTEWQMEWQNDHITSAWSSFFLS